jgi:hypothetical protein
MIIFMPSSRAARHSRPSIRSRMTWSWRNSCSSLTRPRLPHRCFTQTTPLPCLPLLRLVSLAMATRVKDRVATAVTIVRTAEATVAAVATLLARATRARAASLALPLLLQPLNRDHQHVPQSDSWGEAVATSPFTAVGSHRCAWTDHGQPSVHTTLGTDPGSIVDVCCIAAACCFSILDALPRLMGPAVTGRVGHRFRCVESHHA